MSDDAITNKVPKNRRSRLRWLWRGVLTLIALTMLLCVSSFIALISLGAEAPVGAKADCIFVPGAAVWRKRKPSEALEARLLKAVQLYRAGAAPLIVVSGGGVGDYQEADVMADWLVEHGVPAGAIIRERESRTTRENAQLSAPLLHKRGIKSAIAVSQWFHLGRVRVCLEQEGIQTFAVNCRGPKLVSEPIFLIKEIFGLPIYAMRLDLLR
ncbi:MAG: YdcF family protein [Planctomycetes bacterium]|nr:YdcF family protein [Planctomycetota bacterium]